MAHLHRREFWGKYCFGNYTFRPIFWRIVTLWNISLAQLKLITFSILFYFTAADLGQGWGYCQGTDAPYTCWLVNRPRLYGPAGLSSDRVISMDSELCVTEAARVYNQWPCSPATVSRGLVLYVISCESPVNWWFGCMCESLMHTLRPPKRLPSINLNNSVRMNQL